MQVSPKVGNPNVGNPYVGKPYPLVRLRGSKNESSKDTPPSKRPDSPYTATNRLRHHIPLPSTGNGVYGHESRAYDVVLGRRDGRGRKTVRRGLEPSLAGIIIVRGEGKRARQEQSRQAAETQRVRPQGQAQVEDPEGRPERSKDNPRLRNPQGESVPPWWRLTIGERTF